jgi:D-alanine-D-alanine ligase-like ATP-grasp enzyme
LAEFNHISQKEIENIHPKIKNILTYLIKASEKILNRRNGTFELLGCDILFDDKVNPHLLEVNTNPAIFTGM